MNDLQATDAPAPEATPGEPPEATAEHKALIERWCDRIATAKKFHEPAFKRMREDQKFAADTNGEQWQDPSCDKYVANLTIRHVRNKVGSLYAKNPRVKARRAERMEYTLWDGKLETLNSAINTMQSAVPQPPTVDQATGMVMPPPPPPDPAQLAYAQMLIQDAVQGFQRKQMMDRVGKTLEILYHHQMNEQNPTYKAELKQLVRRVVTCGVGYVKMGFQRNLDRDPNTIKRLTDSTRKLAVIERLMSDCQDPYEHAGYEAEKAELENAVKTLEESGEVVVREGLAYSYPLADQVIIDPRCRQISGLVGAGWIAIEHMMTRNEVKEAFQVDLDKSYRGYIRVPSAVKDTESRSVYTTSDRGTPADDDYACVYEVQDKKGENVFWICEGYCDYLRAPAAPGLRAERFFDVYELVFNAVENQYELFPPSDVRLLRHQQKEHNRSREALREHRIAAAPRFGSTVPLDDEVRARISMAVPHEIIDLAKGLAPGTKVSDIFSPINMPAIDPALYDSTPIMDDIQKVAGAQEANFGGLSGGTATESTIAEGARVTSVEDNKDDLDEFLTLLARDGGQVLLREVSKETAMKIVGPGAAWPEFSNEEIREELYLEVIAGSSGRPNKAMDVANFERVAPLLLQIPGIKPEFMARTALQILDDRLDIDEAVAQELPSIIALNQIAGKPAGQPATGDPATDPAQQGPQGGNQQAANPSGAQPPPEGQFPAPV